MRVHAFFVTTACALAACSSETRAPNHVDATGVGDVDGDVSAGEPESEVEVASEVASEVEVEVEVADTTQPRTHGLEQRVPNTTCFLPGAPPLEVVPIATTPVYPDFEVSNGSTARTLIALPGRDALAVVESGGQVRSFTTNGTGAAAVVVLDLGASLRADGLRAAAYRPDGGAIIASFIPADDPLRLVVARFPIRTEGADAGTADVAGREDLATIGITDVDRVGGMLQFLLDGTLTVAVGDGGDPTAAADPLSLAGKVLRFDVSGGVGAAGAIPSDNPFFAHADTRPEIYAFGLGAPTSCGMDRITERLWCADAGLGPGATDGLVIVTSGATLYPIRTLPHAACGLTVGSVSRDPTLPDIQGALVFGHACDPTLSALRFDGSLIRSEATIATLPAPLATFGEDADGRMFAVDAAGHLHALVRPATPAPAFPTTVSATGCRGAASLIPFEVRAPLWSDGAKKHRFISLPGDTQIGFTTTGAWSFPAGTIFMKEFLLDDDNVAASEPRLMETRFFVKRSETQWEGYSYMWDRAEREGFLLDGAEIERYPMAPGAADASGASVHRHTFPDRVQCLLCHNADSGRALGLQTGRMNTDHDYDGFVENQLAAMDHIGLFAEPLPAAPEDLPRFAEPTDPAAPIEDRARAWLYANCSHCHRPGSVTPVALDLRYETPFAATRTCGLKPKFKLSQIPDASIIDPGHADNSELFFRLSRRDANQMPPIATLILDPTGVEAVRAWIDGLSECPATP